jgi:hypothetical protein
MDLATVTGVAEWDCAEPTPRFCTIRFATPGVSHAEAFTRARRWADDRFSLGDIAVVYTEATLRMGAARGQTNADTIKRLVGLWAVIAAAAGVWRVRHCDVDVQDIRDAFLGNGRLKGEVAKPRALEMARAIGWTPNTLDEADAAALLHYAQARETPKSVKLISPMLQRRVATAVENARILREAEKRGRNVRRARA